jgi:hypothetical protein
VLHRLRQQQPVPDIVDVVEAQNAGVVVPAVHEDVGGCGDTFIDTGTFSTDKVTGINSKCGNR